MFPQRQAMTRTRAGQSGRFTGNCFPSACHREIPAAYFAIKATDQMDIFPAQQMSGDAMVSQNR